MTRESSFVALKAFRFGTEMLQIGDPVPVEAGRDYRLMLRLGQIGPASITAPAEPQATPERAVLLLHRGGHIVFVAEDGKPELATFTGTESADQDTAAGLGVELGSTVAVLVFADDPNPVFVALPNLLPGEAATRLIAFDQAQLAQAREDGVKATELAQQTADVTVQALRGDVAFLQLLLKAIRTEGDPLGADFPAAKELQGNGLVSRQGLLLLAEGEQGWANLTRLDSIGKGRADKIMAALFPDRPAPADAPPEPAAAPESPTLDAPSASPEG